MRNHEHFDFAVAIFNHSNPSDRGMMLVFGLFGWRMFEWKIQPFMIRSSGGSWHLRKLRRPRFSSKVGTSDVGAKKTWVRFDLDLESPVIFGVIMWIVYILHIINHYYTCVYIYIEHYVLFLHVSFWRGICSPIQRLLSLCIVLSNGLPIYKWRNQ